ncbi:hypothetical protein [Saccharicrinis aurantiacus]|uniref:hypothetical protein n=1 Tax=Saccharicrinis aurantiacus TaxID=1849719 RepID=UPI00094FEB73|nr:hypothetical protein [Saccharicrinis aurantiacus]
MSTPKKQRTTLNLIYIAIMSALTLMAIFAMYFVRANGAVEAFSPDSNYTIKTMVIMALLIGIPVSHLFYHKKIKHISQEWELSRRLTHFRTAFIVRIAVLEGVGLLSIIAYLLNADKSFMYMFGVIFVLFIIHAPTRNRIATDLELNEEEQAKL